MSAPESEKELESFLKKQRSLLRSRLFARERLEPPPELDRIVLKRARLAIELTPAARPAAHPHRHRWLAPFGVAASILVCLTLVIDLGTHSLRSRHAAPALHETAEASASQQADLSSVQESAGAAEPVYSSGLYSRFAANAVPASAPIFEVVIRSARLAAPPVSTDSPRSADAASR